MKVLYAQVYAFSCRCLQDERARISLCENQQWLPLVVLLGLVCCNVPAKLKAELLKALGALCRTPDIAATFWQSLEVSQVCLEMSLQFKFDVFSWNYILIFIL